MGYRLGSKAVPFSVELWLTWAPSSVVTRRLPNVAGYPELPLEDGTQTRASSELRQILKVTNRLREPPPQTSYRQYRGDATVVATLNRELSTVSTWLSTWKLEANIDKCKVMFITTRTLPQPIPPVTLGGTVLQVVTSHKHLGVTLTNTLSWSQHIEVISNKARRSSGLLCALRRKIPQNLLLRLYITITRPTLEYADIVWAGLTLRDQRTLESVQYQTARLISGHFGIPYPSYNSLYTELSLPSLQFRRKFHTAVTMYKLLNGRCPPHLQSLLPQARASATESRYPLRNREQSNMSEDITITDVTPRVNANNAKRIRSDVFPNPVYEAECNPSKTDADKTVEGDADVEPYAVAYRGQNSTYMRNVPQQASCKSTGICIAVIIAAAMLAIAMVIVGTWLYVQKPTQPAVDTTYTIGYPAVDTTYTPGQPAVDTTYTTDYPAVYTTYIIGQPAVDTTYTIGQPAVDTTYTPGGTTNMSARSTIQPLGTTGPEREVSINGLTAPATAIQKENGKTAECDPDSENPCCSTGYWCGSTEGHCDCYGCKNYKRTGLLVVGKVTAQDDGAGGRHRETAQGDGTGRRRRGTAQGDGAGRRHRVTAQGDGSVTA
ncbi:hypothetical protein Bbelb_365880 [Branchiostoma belcheri]|nr:hypothetical protein Bbelb_365880 [Branchiostoma belcheri]